MSRRFTRVSLLLSFCLRAKFGPLDSATSIWIRRSMSRSERKSLCCRPARMNYRILRSHWRQPKRSPVTALTDRSISRKSNSTSSVAALAAVLCKSAPAHRSPNRFLTFLVEATWSSGRLLREYTVLLDPPTYVAPAVQQAPVVEAPRRSTPSDSGRIERQPHRHRYQRRNSASGTAAGTAGSQHGSFFYNPDTSRHPTAPQPSMMTRPTIRRPAAILLYNVVRPCGGSLHAIGPDSRLTMNQTMLAIYEANPDAFAGNINVLKAGSSLRNSKCRRGFPNQSQ